MKSAPRKCVGLVVLLISALFAACDDTPKALPGTGAGGTGGALAGGVGSTGGSLALGGAISGGAGNTAGAASGTAGFTGLAGNAGTPANPIGGAADTGGGRAGASFGGETGGSSGVAGNTPTLTRFLSYDASPYPSENPDFGPKALLGKILFWEEQLSHNGTVACGTCHRPKAGGSDPRSATPQAHLPGPDAMLDTDDDVRGSLGVIRCDSQGVQTGSVVQVTGRKAPSYLDAMFSPQLFWDGRAECRGPSCPSFTAFEDPDNPGQFPIAFGGGLENQAVGPPMSPVEMACEAAAWPALHARLASAQPLKLASQIPADLAQLIAENTESYPKLFAHAFGTTQTSGPVDEINTRRIAFAIATHERRLRSDQTPWDRWNAGDDSALTPAQLRGFELFNSKARCVLCHQLPTFADGAFHFIGFHKPTWDLGRNAIRPATNPPGAIRTPTLRNVALREASGLLRNGAGPGASLEKLMDLYNQGGLVNDAEIAAVPISPTIRPLNLAPQELLDIIDFLRNGLTDPRVAAESAPFDRPKLSTE